MRLILSGSSYAVEAPHTARQTLAEYWGRFGAIVSSSLELADEMVASN